MPLFRTVRVGTSGDVRLEQMTTPLLSKCVFPAREAPMTSKRLLWENKYPHRRWRGPRNRAFCKRPSTRKVRRGTRYSVNFERVL